MRVGGPPAAVPIASRSDTSKARFSASRFTMPRDNEADRLSGGEGKVKHRISNKQKDPAPARGPTLTYQPHSLTYKRYSDYLSPDPGTAGVASGAAPRRPPTRCRIS